MANYHELDGEMVSTLEYCKRMDWNPNTFRNRKHRLNLTDEECIEYCKTHPIRNYSECDTSEIHL